MARVRYRAMYLTSFFAGCLSAVALSIMGYRVQWPLIGATAREHAEAAARKEGPYLAPITLALILAAGAVFVVMMIRWIS